MGCECSPIRRTGKGEGNDHPLRRVQQHGCTSLPALRNARSSALILLPLAGLLLAVSCRKDELFTDEPVQLVFSEDTVMFDTVFTTLTSSVTKRFTARNTSSNAVSMDVALEGGTPSPFRINVDGSTGTSFSDVQILGGDSIYVFVEVLPGAGGVNTPFIIEDHVLFNTNGAEQSVALTVWGQDAHFFPNTDRPVQHVSGFPAFSYIAGGFDDMGNQICEDIIWPNDKPYVIYGYGVVDSCCSLTIEAGVRVYFHGGGGLWVYRNGRLNAQGTVEERITFQGDRLEAIYQDLPGQWDRIWINEGEASMDNVLTNVVIRNSLIGIQCETVPWHPELPTTANKLVLDNVRIENASAAGILSRNYRIESTNLLVADCGQYCMALTGGGQYTFNHTTVANYWAWAVRNTPAFIMTNQFSDIDGLVQTRTIDPSTFTNGIIYGANTNEFELDLDGGATTDFTFDHWLFRTDQSTSDPAHFITGIIRNQAPGFVNSSEADYHLVESGGVARDGGVAGSDPEAIFDLDGNLRGDGQPDLGCYEWVE